MHLVDEQYDHGRIILQRTCPVVPGDTADSLAQRVHAGEHIILPRAVSWFAAGRLRLTGASVMLDGRALHAPVSVDEEGAVK